MPPGAREDSTLGAIAPPKAALWSSTHSSGIDSRHGACRSLGSPDWHQHGRRANFASLFVAGSIRRTLQGVTHVRPDVEDLREWSTTHFDNRYSSAGSPGGGRLVPVGAGAADPSTAAAAVLVVAGLAAVASDDRSDVHRAATIGSTPTGSGQPINDTGPSVSASGPNAALADEVVAALLSGSWIAVAVQPGAVSAEPRLSGVLCRGATAVVQLRARWRDRRCRPDNP